jgi:DDE superfamily endonuclease
MLTLPAVLSPLIVEFAPLFSKPVWEHAQVLLVGAILAPGKHTVTACLRIMGLSQEKGFVNYHRVLNRARWSPLAASYILLRLLVTCFAPAGELVFGLDDTIERRRGEHITAKGIYRDPVRSSQAHFVKVSGLRWLCCMVLTQVSWAGSTWGLPFLTVLCPSERYHTERGRRHQKLTERARQIVRLLTRWLSDRQLIFVGDGGFAALELLHAVSQTSNAHLITRLRLDAELWHPAPQRKPHQQGRPRVKGARRPSPKQRLDDPNTPWTSLEVECWYGSEKREVEIYTETCVWYKSGFQPVLIRWVLVRDPRGQYEPQAFLSTCVDHTPAQILSWFVRRWRMEVTFEEARAHLGMETQRQWSDLAIARTTPVLLGLFSVVALMADRLIKRQVIAVRTAAWYTKELPTFADALAMTRRCLWKSCHFSTSTQSRDVVKVPRALLERLTDAVCYAA